MNNKRGAFSPKRALGRKMMKNHPLHDHKASLASFGLLHQQMEQMLLAMKRDRAVKNLSEPRLRNPPMRVQRSQIQLQIG